MITHLSTQRHLRVKPGRARLRVAAHTALRKPLIMGSASFPVLLSPDAGEGGLDYLLEAGDRFTVGGAQRLLGFDLGDDGLLRGAGWEGNCETENRGI